MLLDETKVLQNLPFVVAATSNGIGLTADAAGTLNFQIDLDLDFSFGIDLSDGLAPEERFFIEVDDFKVGGTTAGQNLNFGLAVGFLGAQVQGGSFNLNTLVDVDVLNPDADSQGHITLSELLGTTIGGLIDPTVTTGTLAGNLPVSVQALGGFTAGNAAVAVSGNPFSGAPDGHGHRCRCRGHPEFRPRPARRRAAGAEPGGGVVERPAQFRGVRGHGPAREHQDLRRGAAIRREHDRRA